MTTEAEALAAMAVEIRELRRSVDKTGDATSRLEDRMVQLTSASVLSADAMLRHDKAIDNAWNAIRLKADQSEVVAVDAKVDALYELRWKAAGFLLAISTLFIVVGFTVKDLMH